MYLASPVTLEQHNDRTFVQGAPPQVISGLSAHLRYKTAIATAQENGWALPEGEEDGQPWDGWVRYLSIPKRMPPHFPTGLIPEVQHCLRFWGVPHQVWDRRDCPQEAIPEFPRLELRPYQLEAVREAMRAGRGVFDMVPRSGKTHTAMELVRQINQPTLWIAPTDRIVTQTWERFEGHFGKNYAAQVVGGRDIRGGPGLNAQVVLCTVATAVRLPDEFYRTRQCLIVDEWHHCFSATTQVMTTRGWRAIESLTQGDVVWSHGPSGFEQRSVVNKWVRRAPPQMLRIKTEIGIMEVTGEHRIYTPGGQKKAMDLRVGGSVCMLEVWEGDRPTRAVHSAREGLSGTGGRFSEMRIVRGADSQAGIRWTQDELLRAQCDARPGDARQRYESSGEEQRVQKASFRPDAGGPKSSEAGGGSSKNIRVMETGTDQGSVWARSVWEGPQTHTFGDSGAGCAGQVRVSAGVQSIDSFAKNERECSLVFDRSGECGTEDRGRIGWVEPREQGRRGLQEGREFGGAGLGRVSDTSTTCKRRVGLGAARIESIERITAPGPYVYDLEVEGLHNYFVQGGIKVSNSAARSYREIFGRCKHIYWRFGLTGTFFRSGEDAMAMHALLSRTVVKVTAQDMVNRGYLVPSRVAFLRFSTKPLRRGVGLTFNTHHGKLGIHEHRERNQLVTHVATKLAQAGKKVLVIVGTRAQGQKLLEWCRALMPGPSGARFEPVEYVNSKVDRPRINDIIDSYIADPTIKVLIGTSLVGEGVDLPPADCLVYAKGERAEVPLTQNDYRVSTAAPGKREALIVDFVDRHHPKLLDHSLDRLAVRHAEPTFSIDIFDWPGFSAWAGVTE